MENEPSLSLEEDLRERRAQKDFAIMMWEMRLIRTTDEAERERIKKEIERLEKVRDQLK